MPKRSVYDQLLNEVLSITAQEYVTAEQVPSVTTVLNEVLSITAQEFRKYNSWTFQYVKSSMKS